MELELSKKERKIARELIDKGLQEDIKRGLLEFDAILQKWKDEAGHSGDCFYTLYESIRDYRKWIASKYDHMPGSRYMETLIYQLYNDLYPSSELDEFRSEIKDYILLRVKRAREE
jgi:hypothetical protein